MTDQECFHELKLIEQIHDKEVRKLIAKRDRDRKKALNQWAKDNHRFNVGDIVRKKSHAIRINGYFGRLSDYNPGQLIVMYRGTELDASLNDTNITAFFYDDGTNVEKVNP